ncbi:MAG: hypothetical protein ABID54_09470 [Pseudomonadota bacterium]
MNWKWKNNKSGQLVCKEASDKLREAAIYRSAIIQFARVEPKSESNSNLSTMSQTKITVSEGIHHPIPCRKEDLVCFNPTNPVQNKLITDLQVSYDTCSMDAIKGHSLRVSNLYIDTLAGPLNTMNAVQFVANFAINNIEPYDANFYIGLAGERIMDTICGSPIFEKWKVYLREGDVLFEGEEGKWNRIRWMRITNDKLLFPDEAVVMGGALYEVQTEGVDLRISESESDKIGWYGCFGFGTKKENVIYISDGRSKK